MAYGTKYRASFTVLEGPSKILTDYVISFQKNGYTGSTTDLPYLGGGAIKAKINNTQDKYIGVQDKTLSIDILSETNLSELLKANPKDWMVEIQKVEGATTTIDFRGYLQPSKNSTPHQDGSINYNLEACDGLTFLKNIDFVDDDSIYYEGLASVFEVISLCLRKIGTSLKVNTINNTYNVDDGISDAAEPLKQRYIDLDLFRGENEPLDTYKVLSSIMETEKMRLFQEDGEWWMIYIPELVDGQAKSRKYYLSDGDQISYGNLDLRVSAVHNSTDFQPMGGGSVSNLTPVKYAKVTHKLGGWKNKLLNKDLAEWDGDDFENWTRFGTDVFRIGDGTSGNLYGIKIPGFYTGKVSNASGIYQRLVIIPEGDAILKIEKNITFKGVAFTQNVEYAIIQCVLRIVTYDYGTISFGMLDDGSWTQGGATFELRNIDVNNHSKKTPVNWDTTSKNIGELKAINIAGKRIPWRDSLRRVEIDVILAQGKNQLIPYPGEGDDCAVWYNNIQLGLINADTNLNLKEIYYKATQEGYSPNNVELESVYGDYTDSGNLSALKNTSGQVTKLWKSATDSTGRNFHTIGAADILQHQAQTQKVYDGTIWGRLKYRHIISLAGFTNYGYIVSYTYNYGSSFCDVRIVEFQGYISYTQKKTGVLTDGTEINLVEEMLPSPFVGNKPTLPRRSFDDANNWFKKVVSGIAVTNDDDETGLLIWDGFQAADKIDFGNIVQRGDTFYLGANATNTQVNFGGDNYFFRNYLPEDESIDGLVLKTGSSGLFLPDAGITAPSFQLWDIFGISNSSDGAKTQLVAKNRIYQEGRGLDFVSTGNNPITYYIGENKGAVLTINRRFAVGDIDGFNPLAKVHAVSTLGEIDSLLFLTNKNTNTNAEAGFAISLDANNQLAKIISSTPIDGSYPQWFLGNADFSGEVNFTTKAPISYVNAVEDNELVRWGQMKDPVVEYGQIQGHEQYTSLTSFLSANRFGHAFINSSGLIDPETEEEIENGLPFRQGSVIKLGIGNEYSDQYSIIAIGRPFPKSSDVDDLHFDGNLYYKGFWGGFETDGWKKIGGSAFEDIEFGDGEISRKFYGAYLRGSDEKDDKHILIGADKVNGGLTFITNTLSDDGNTTYTYTNWINPANGRLTFLTSTRSDEYLLKSEAGTGGSKFTTVASPLFVSANGTEIGMYRANANNDGFVTKEDWRKFNGQFTLPSGNVGDFLMYTGDTAIWMPLSIDGGIAGVYLDASTYNPLTLVNGTSAPVLGILAANENFGGYMSAISYRELQTKIADGSFLNRGLVFRNGTFLSGQDANASLQFINIAGGISDTTNYADLALGKIEGTDSGFVRLQGYGNIGVSILTENQELSIVSANGNLVITAANGKLYINGNEWDWSGKAVGKVLMMTAANKMGWVTP